MAKVNSFLTERLKQATQKFSKMTALAELSTKGDLSSFSGIFRVTPLSIQEHEALQEILSQHSTEDANVSEDLIELSKITTEVKAINNQAAILHGERIKKAQQLLKKYRDGAFSSWLVATYGNRQTPYNFLQYFELYESLPQPLHTKIEEMPRQAVYALASRTGAEEKKREIIENYKGQPKQELLSLIRQTFPLAKEDRRAQDLADLAISSLARLQKLFRDPQFSPSSKQKREIQELLNSLISG
ncbi:MAG: CT583 family protein [Chlamydiales bacterium]|nr:CT583 family protein [Chlamydiales bacterium]